MQGDDRLWAKVRAERRPATPQIYGLFERRPDGSWFRKMASMAFPKEQAIRVFQSMLLACYLRADCGVRELRPVGHVLPRR